MHEKIAWEVIEYEHRDKTPDWYWAVGIIALSAAIIAIVYKNYIFAVFIVIASATLFMFSFRKPEMLLIELTEKGVRMKNEFFPYKMIKTFWISDRGPVKKLLLHSNRILMPVITIAITDEMEEKIKSTLLKHLEEKEMHEPMTQRIMEQLGF
jgi:hypothetical protein